MFTEEHDRPGVETTDIRKENSHNTRVSFINGA